MQHKEKKWLEIEKILSIYCEHDEELKDKLTELKYRVVGDKKITNVVEENQNLKTELDDAKLEIERLRDKFIEGNVAGNMSPKQLANHMFDDDMGANQFMCTAPIDFAQPFEKFKMESARKS